MKGNITKGDSCLILGGLGGGGWSGKFGQRLDKNNTCLHNPQACKKGNSPRAHILYISKFNCFS